MENGVKIIIERLKTNPEEFGEGKWLGIVRAYRKFMSEEDRVALDEALRPVIMEKFNEDVLNTLMRTENESQGELDLEPFGSATVKGGTITYKTKGRYKTP